MKDNIKPALVILVIIASCFLFSLTGGLIKFPGMGLKDSTNSTDVRIHPPTLSNELIHISKPTSLVFINASVKGYSYSALPLCQGTYTDNSSINLHLKSSSDIRWNLTSEEDAPKVAEQVMESYGGIPPDAVSNGASIHYIRQYNISRNEVVSEEPMFTSISYSQNEVNGLWVLGDSNFLNLELGDYGEPLLIYKRWRNYTCSGNVPIISFDSAIKKLDRREFLDSEWHPEAGDITIDVISPGYYAKELPNNDTVLEPIWMFFGGNATTGARLGFNVYARQFANFTVNQLSGEVPLNVSFSDISDTSPEKWLWDFGDGTTSTLRDPSHIYKQPGLYNVTLTVWNDLGSNTVLKQSLITVFPNGIPVPDSVLSDQVNTTGTPARGK